MSPRSKGQLEVVRQKSRQAILDGALKLFANRGYSETTTADIAREAGVSKGLLYNYFTSKDEILQRILVEGFHKAIPQLIATDTHRHPTLLMEELLHAWFRLIRSDGDLIRLGVQMHLNPEIRDLVRAKGEDVIETFSGSFKGLFARLGSDNPAFDMFLLGTIMDGVVLNYGVAPDLYPIDAMEEYVVTHFSGRGRTRS